MLESSIENRLEMPPTIQKRQLQFAFINEKSHNCKLLLLLMFGIPYTPFRFYAAEKGKRGVQSPCSRQDILLYS